MVDAEAIIARTMCFNFGSSHGNINMFYSQHGNGEIPL
jgi:hypothetical protein